MDLAGLGIALGAFALGFACNAVVELWFHRQTRRLLSAEIERGHAAADARAEKIVADVRAAVPDADVIAERVKAAVLGQRGGLAKAANAEAEAAAAEVQGAVATEGVIRTLGSALGDERIAEAVVALAQETRHGRGLLAAALAQPQAATTLLSRFITRAAGGIQHGRGGGGRVDYV